MALLTRLTAGGLGKDPFWISLRVYYKIINFFKNARFILILDEIIFDLKLTFTKYGVSG